MFWSERGVTPAALCEQRELQSAILAKSIHIAGVRELQSAILLFQGKFTEALQKT
ncbi:hypothetical protein GCM10008018_18520 [Paenibacillus marchantiophytorum]|uniref:Uncharacterized protein n=1 Tax=Paenibacillus marchantiophytorum TaxID=1619310 RepID=A0ABQ2BUW5_9BACL|nr:hypothetical protein GCM10008018_18520 [Paenibacillus marchantiophytorum]